MLLGIRKLYYTLYVLDFHQKIDCRAQAVDVCGECWTVSGPSGGQVDYFNYAAASNSSYELQVSWDSAYRGPVSVAVEPTRCVFIRTPYIRHRLE
jgi:hypothetical protein